MRFGTAKLAAETTVFTGQLVASLPICRGQLHPTTLRGRADAGMEIDWVVEPADGVITYQILKYF